MESGFEVVLSEVLSEELVGLVIDVVEEKNVEETVVQEACTQLLVGVVDEETNLSVQQTLAILKEEELERKYIFQPQNIGSLCLFLYIDLL